MNAFGYGCKTQLLYYCCIFSLFLCKFEPNFLLYSIGDKKKLIAKRNPILLLVKASTFHSEREIFKMFEL